MSGKRPRLMRRTLSVASLGAGSEPVQNPAEFQPSMDSPCPSSSSSQSKSRPFNHLMVDSSSGASDKVGLGILAALEAPSPPGTMFRSIAPPNQPYVAAASSNGYDFSKLISGKQQQQQQMETGNVDFLFQGSNSRYHHHHHQHMHDRLRSTLDFLKACFLCKRDIAHGDIYMYRGDRAFCSAECRQQQILTDERIERRPKCSSTALKQIGGSNQQSRHVNQRAKVAPATTAAAA